MKNSLFFCFILLLASLDSYTQRVCGADHYHEEQMKNPKYRYFFEIAQRAIHSKINSGERFSCTNTITIPLAFHFNGAIDNSNMTCIMSQINSQIATLNQDFGGYNSDIVNYCNWSSSCPTQFPPNSLGSNSCIQFCLASTLPAGQSSPITFGQYTYPSASDWIGIFNVFVSDISPPNQSEGLLGLAPPGGANTPNGNGMFIKNIAFGAAAACTSGVGLNTSPKYNKGRSGTHEAGHYFGLLHIFAGCNNGDGIADTPNQETDNGGNPIVNTSNCTTTAINSCGTIDFFFNYMDYVDDKSMYMFTDDQMQVMNGYAGSQSKWTGGCTSSSYVPIYINGCPSSSPPVANFSHDYGGNPLCAALAKINFLDTSTGFPTSWYWTFSGAGVNPTISTVQNPMVTFTSSGTITAVLVSTNSAGSSIEKIVNFPVFINTPDNCGNCGQTFIDDGGATANYPPNDKTYVFCSNNAAQTIQVDFTSIGLEAFSNNFESTDHIKVYNGTTATGTPVNYIFGTSIYTLNGTLLTSIGNAFVGTQQCATFVFDYSDNASNATFAGWSANISCINMPTCSDGLQNQNETFVDCGGECPPCPDICNNFTFTDPGGTSGPANFVQKQWQLCASVPDHVIVDFTTIALTPGSSQLQVFEGTTFTGNPAYILNNTSIFKFNGTAYSIISENTIVSTGQCFSMKYVSGTSPGMDAGWVAKINCCANGICPSATNEGRPIVGEIVSTVCPGYNLTNFTMFREQFTGDRACTTPNLEFKTYYMVQCDGIGGVLGIDVSANSSGGNVQAGLYGPLSGTCPNYTGGTYVDCEDGVNPAPISITNAPPNSLYAVVISSERPGDFTINSLSGFAVLPVAVASFSATSVDDDIRLEWSTLSETNNERFDIERSSDAIHFESISTVQGKGNSKTKEEYNYVDNALSNGHYYYRLKQIDYDGQFTYSDIISGTINGNIENINIFPNPTNNRLYIESDNLMEDIHIFNLMGETMLERLAQKNQTRQDLDLSHFSAGIYFIKIKVNGKAFKSHFIKVD